MTLGPSCPLPLAPVCDVAGAVGSGIVSTGAGAVLSAVVGWIVSGASWLLDQIGGVLSSTTTVDLGASWYSAHYRSMVAIAGVVAVPLLLVATVQAVVRQSPAVLVRLALVELPLAGLLAGVAVQLVQLALAATDALSSTVSAGSGADVAHVLSGVAALLLAEGAGGPASAPAFVVGLGALLVVVGALVLWLELLVRAAAVYVAVLFLPLALASLLWPAISHWCRRLVETLAALILSKFVIVAVLSLAAGALGSGSGFSAVLAGGALLLLAAFTPFTLLRLVPMLEAGAAMQLEGARHRARQALGSVPSTAASFALGQLRDLALVADVPGIEGHVEPGAPGGGSSGTRPPGPGSHGEEGAGGSSSAGDGGGDAGAWWLPQGTGGDDVAGPPPGPLWRGNPESVRAFEEAMAAPPPPRGAGTGGILPGSPMPMWGGNLPGFQNGGSPDDAGSPGPTGDLTLVRDHMGPVLRWVPRSDGLAPGGSEPGTAQGPA